jgi:murein DD-endopeptidase MepM/ murein hydrolase activator NlpD
MKKYRFAIIVMIAVVLSRAVGGFFFPGEFEAPDVQLMGSFQAVGRQGILNVALKDDRTGLSRATLSITQGDQTVTLVDTSFPGKAVHDKTLQVTIDPVARKLKDGPAVLTISAEDRSRWRNKATLSKVIRIDVVPPQVFLLTPTNHVNPGGSCMIVYRASKPLASSGVRVNDLSFPSYPISLAGKPAYIAYFAMPLDTPPGGTQVRVFARDQGGNEAISGVPYLLLKKKFRNDKMSLSERFLQQKMPEFVMVHPDLRDKSLIDVFAYVNAELRKSNDHTIREICRTSEARQLWQDVFLRMKDAAPMAQFGDRRTWMYGGRVIGDSLHLGVDLASTAQAPIESANNGIVAFAGPLGIYGNTVIVDHGQGLFTLYAHLSDVSTQKGQAVKRGETLGRSGLSGLAGGDHLHFSMIVAGQFVNPTEWWDAHWIADNIQKKMPASY